MSCCQLQSTPLLLSPITPTPNTPNPSSPKAQYCQELGLLGYRTIDPNFDEKNFPIVLSQILLKLGVMNPRSIG